MPRKKQYADARTYERKLDRVMERFGVEEYTYNFDRYRCWVQFRYRGELYAFEHSVEKAREAGFDLAYGSDAFAQIVLALEDLARIVERGIYDLQRWTAGMKFLPPAQEIPPFFKALGFTEVPSGRAEVNDRYRELAKRYHPDNTETGDAEAFMAIRKAAEQALAFFGGEN